MFSFLYEYTDFYRTGLYIWATRRVSYNKQKPLTLRELRVVMSVAISEQQDILFVFTSSCSCLFIFSVFVCAEWCPTRIVLCFSLDFLGIVYAILPVLLDCPFLVPSSVVAYVYLRHKRDDFNYAIMHVSHLVSNISTAFAYAVNILR